MPRHKLTADAIEKSRALRSAASTVYHADVRLALREIELEARQTGGEPLAETLKGLAAQLNAKGIRTTRGSEMDEKKVHAALGKLGLDLTSIRRWKNRYRSYASKLGISPDVLLRQLWREWWWNEAKLYYTAGKQGEKPFKGMPVHPDVWIDPEKREPQYHYFDKLADIPNARLVRALIGAFERVDD